MLKIAILVGLTNRSASCLEGTRNRYVQVYNKCCSTWIWWSMGQSEWASSGNGEVCVNDHREI